MDASHQPDFSAVRLDDGQRWRILPTISAASVQIVEEKSTPDNHFTAGPHCRVPNSGGRRVGGADGSPTVCAGIISATCPENLGIAKAAPDNHFTASPHCCVTGSCRWRVDDAGG